MGSDSVGGDISAAAVHQLAIGGGLGGHSAIATADILRQAERRALPTLPPPTLRKSC